MKKLILVPAAGLLLFGGIAFANSNEGTQQDTQQQTAVVETAAVNSEKEKIGFGKAEQIARDIIDGQMTDIELERDNGKQYYDIEMYANGYEYDIEVEAITGEVLKNKREKDNDFDDDDKKAVSSQTSKENGETSSAVKISAEDAVKAALAVVSGEVEDVELEHDDGRVYYDIEIDNRYEEHEVKVDATNGEILEVETDIED